jgi:L-threonylcarbamoyladenylate synthase
MNTRWQKIDPQHPEAELLAEAGAILRQGGLVAFPTETVYGLGANALDAAAVQGIFTAKGRPANNPIIVHVADLAHVAQVAAELPAVVPLLAEQFWPGPLTLVLPKQPHVPSVVTAGGPTVAVRVPRHPVALGLIRAAGVPLAAPSANRSEQLSPTMAEHVWRDLQGRIDLLLDGGPTAGGIESTVLDVTVTPPRLLRPGLISAADLEALLGPVQRSAGVNEAPTLPSPGMLRRHYAPRTPLELVDDADEGRQQVQTLARAGKKIGWLTLQPESSREGSIVVQMPPTAVAYAAKLYAVLHDLDQQQLDRIVVVMPPQTEEWLAIRDRLQRAAQPR